MCVFLFNPQFFFLSIGTDPFLIGKVVCVHYQGKCGEDQRHAE